MAPGHLKVLRSQASEGHIPGLEEMKDHFSGSGPLDVADRSASSRGKKSWTGESVKGWTEGMSRFPSRPPSPTVRKRVTSLGSPDVTAGRRAGRMVLEETGDSYSDEQKPEAPAKLTIGTRLTMTSRTGFFQDRIISPSMVSVVRARVCSLANEVGVDAGHGHPIHRPEERESRGRVYGRQFILT